MGDRPPPPSFEFVATQSTGVVEAAKCESRDRRAAHGQPHCCLPCQFGATYHSPDCDNTARDKETAAAEEALERPPGNWDAEDEGPQYLNLKFPRRSVGSICIGPLGSAANVIGAGDH